MSKKILPFEKWIFFSSDFFDSELFPFLCFLVHVGVSLTLSQRQYDDFLFYGGVVSLIIAVAALFFKRRLILVCLLFSWLGVCSVGVRVASVSEIPHLKNPIYNAQLMGVVSDLSRYGDVVRLQVCTGQWDNALNVRLSNRLKREFESSHPLGTLCFLMRMDAADFHSAFQGFSLFDGQRVLVQGDFYPSPPGVLPFGQDARFNDFFDGITARGFIKNIKNIDVGETHDHDVNTKTSLEHIRYIITKKILESPYGSDTARGLASALVTGVRIGVDAQMTQAMLASGLMHLLAISGAHMAMITVFLFLLVRSLLLFFPFFGQGRSVQKPAAVVTFFGALFYLLISGGALATVRAFILVCIGLLAILTDRRVMSMRNLALAGVLILVFQPEALFSPSFQMSFAATGILIWLAENKWSHGSAFSEQSFLNHGLLWLQRFVVFSFFAGLVTMPYAAYHFHRLAPYGLFGNMFGVPLVEFMVMPFLLLSVLVMPFHLESVFLSVAFWGLDVMVSLAHKLSTLPQAVKVIAPFSWISIFFVSFGLCVVFAFRSRIKIAGYGLFCLGLFLVFVPYSPAHLAAPFAGTIASVSRSHDGYDIAYLNGSRFYQSVWLDMFFGSRVLENFSDPHFQNQDNLRLDRAYACRLERLSLCQFYRDYPLSRLHTLGFHLSEDVLKNDLPFDQRVKFVDRPFGFDRIWYRVYHRD